MIVLYQYFKTVNFSFAFSLSIIVKTNTDSGYNFVDQWLLHGAEIYIRV